MGFNFPNSPTVGAVANGYTWDGEKWTLSGGATGAVRYDTAQTLTNPQQLQARQNIYAAPFDALAYNGIQVNGSMDVQQTGTSGTSATATYICDGWLLVKVGTMVVLANQYSYLAVPGFANSLSVTVSTAQASLGTTNQVGIYQQIEGSRISRLAWGSANAMPITLGFWSTHHRTGLYSGTVRNGGATRTYAFSYTQAAADTPQYNIITIPGDTTDTWAIDNTAGMTLTFSMGAGPTATAPSANTWLSGSYTAAPGQINGVAATTDIFRITGVIIVPGNEAPSADRSPRIMRPSDQELEICKRYLQLVIPDIRFWAPTASAVASYALLLAPEMRVLPTSTVSVAGTTTNLNSFSLTRTQKNMARVTVVAAAAGDCFLQGSIYLLDARL